VENCITMVNESEFSDNASQWEMWRQDRAAYKAWLTARISKPAAVVRSHGFRFRGQYEEELKQDLDVGGVEITAGIPGENAARKGVPAPVRIHGPEEESIVTGVPEAPGA
jgi:hypothetical protein